MKLSFSLRTVRAALVALPLLAASTFSTFAQDAWTRLMPPEVLNTLAVSNDVQIIDIRKEKFTKSGTVPGAVWIEYQNWRGPKERPGQPPSEAELEAILGNAGVRLDQPIVIFNQTGRTMQNGQAAFVYWLIKSAGSDQVAIMNGGFKAWSKADLPVAEQHAVREPQTVDVTYRYDWWADPVDIFGIASQQVPGAILDARFESQVQKSVETGKPLKSMPLAHYIPVGLVTENLTSERLSNPSLSTYRNSLVERGINVGNETIIAICQTGELSALSWFYASEIVQIEKVQYYPDALHGWQADGGLMFGLNTNR